MQSAKANQDGGKKGTSVDMGAIGVKERKQGTSGSSWVTNNVSFRDKVMGNTGPAKSFCLDEELDGDRLAVVTGGQGDLTPPRVNFTKEAREALSAPYRDALVVKILGAQLSYTAMCFKVKKLWRLKGGCDIMDVGYGYFLVKFDNSEDRVRVISGGPYMIDGKCLAVKTWTPEFRPCEKDFGKTMVWIRIQGLNIWCYEEKSVRRIVSAAGKPVKVDFATKAAERGKFVRACIEVDLGKPVVKTICVDDHPHTVCYEGLSVICGLCDFFGHSTMECRKGSPPGGDIHQPRASETGKPSGPVSIPVPNQDTVQAHPNDSARMGQNIHNPKNTGPSTENNDRAGVNMGEDQEWIQVKNRKNKGKVVDKEFAFKADPTEKTPKQRKNSNTKNGIFTAGASTPKPNASKGREEKSRVIPTWNKSLNAGTTFKLAGVKKSPTKAPRKRIRIATPSPHTSPAGQSSGISLNALTKPVRLAHEVVTGKVTPLAASVPALESLPGGSLVTST